MNDFFAPAIPAESILSSRLRIETVRSDGMAPDLRPNWDMVIIVPTHRYLGEGLYSVDNGVGPDIYRVQNIFGGKLLMKHDNPLYAGSFIMTKDEFEAAVLGFVVADVKARDERMLREAVEVGREN